jgi:hypothetical protein
VIRKCRNFAEVRWATPLLWRVLKTVILSPIPGAIIYPQQGDHNGPLERHTLDGPLNTYERRNSTLTTIR